MKHLGIVAIACASLVRAIPSRLDPREDDRFIDACVKLDAGNDDNCIDKSRECLSNSEAQGYDSLEHCLLMKYGKNGDVFEMVEKACLKLASGRDDTCRAKAEECYFKEKAQEVKKLDICLNARYGPGGKDYYIYKYCADLDRGSDGTCLEKSTECYSNYKARDFDSPVECLRQALIIPDTIQRACDRLGRGSNDTCLDKSAKCFSNGYAQGFDSHDQRLGVELGLEVLSPEQKKEKEEKQAQEQQRQQQEEQERQKGEGRPCLFTDNCGDGLKCRQDPLITPPNFSLGTCETEDEQQWQQKVKELRKKKEQEEKNVRDHACRVSLHNCAQGLECVANNDASKSPVAILPPEFWDQGTCQPKGAQQ